MKYLSMKQLSIILSVLIGLVFMACEKEFDTPPVRTLPVTEQMTISQLRDMLVNQDDVVYFKGDSAKSVYGIISMDEQTGNIYKSCYLQDATAGIELRLLASGGVNQGDSVRVYLKDLKLSSYNGMIQLDSVDVDKNIIKQANLVNLQPLEINNLAEVTASHQGQLIRLNNVQFKENEVGKTFADAENLFAQNRMLEQVTENGLVELIVRTSGYANFADELVPDGNGSVIGVLSQYNSDLQLYLRRPEEIVFPNARDIFVSYDKDFEDDDILSGGWSIENVQGNIDWETNNQGAKFGRYYGQISNYDNGNVACETWYISPQMDLTEAADPSFSFQNACNYNGPDLEVYIIKNYTGDITNTATKLKVSAKLSTGDWTWVNSGNLDIPFTDGLDNIRIGFKYTGTSTSGKTWEIDDIKVNK